MKNNDKTNIVLIGFMGCGKTIVGKKLAKNCNLSFLDTDKMIMKSEKLSINKIFKKFGEDYFRKVEIDICFLASSMKNTVISTGGGIVKDKKNIDNLKKNGFIIYLNSDIKRIYDNLKYDNKRPLLKNKDKFYEIKELFSQRECLYKEYADLVFNIEDYSYSIIAKNIKNTLDKEFRNR